MLLSDGLNYLEVKAQSSGLYLSISEIFVSYQACHFSCALCQLDMSCVLCRDFKNKLQEEQCV